MIKDITDRNNQMLTLENDTTISLKPLIMVFLDGKEYIALTSPSGESESVYFYQYEESQKKDVIITLNRNKQILGRVMDEFEKWMD